MVPSKNIPWQSQKEKKMPDVTFSLLERLMAEN
jgi:hypothetical protein